MFNKVILMGRLTADPELRQTASNISMCRFSVAIDRPYSKDKEKQTDFINVTVWRQTAEFVHKYFAKGKMIIVEGKLQNDNYTDQNGVKHYSMNVVADNVSFGESKGASAQGTGINFTPPEEDTSAPNRTPAALTNTSAGYSNNQPERNSSAIELGELKDFEEILSDGEVPF